MSDIEKLKKLDPEEIYKKTYIAPKVLQYLIEEDFSKIGNRTKALGFIAILERELQLDLSELREKIDEYYGLHQENSVFEIKEKEESKGGRAWIWIVLLALLAGGGYYFYTMQQSKAPQKSPDSFLVAEENETQEENLSQQKSAVAEVNETNRNEEVNASEVNEAQEQGNTSEEENLSLLREMNETNESLEQKSVPQTLTFIPKKKLWLGILYLDDYSRKNYVTSSPIEINTSRDQLIITGHGGFEIEIDNKIEPFEGRGKQRFLYRAGELEKIDVATFKRYNRGKDW